MSRIPGALVGLLLVLYLWQAVPVAHAASYDVNASVPFAAPTQPAIFTTGLDGSTVTNAELVLTGTCQLLNPHTSVSIWRNGSVIGSAPCNGTFSVSVILQQGANTLIARSASVSNNFGPDSSAITLTFALPLTNPPVSPPQPGTPVMPTPQTINYGAATELSVVPSQPFTAMSTDNEVAVDIIVSGGKGPYTVQINWGDGVQEIKVVDELGVHRFTHVYAKPGTYTVRGLIRDVLGAVTSFTYAVVSEKVSTPDVESPLISLPTPSDPKQWWVPLTGIGLGLGVAILGYKLGLLSAAHGAQVRSSRTGTKRWPKK